MLLRGLLVTLELFALSVVAAIAIGLVAAVGRASRWRVLSYPTTAYVEFIRNTPILAQLFWWYYVLPIMTGIELSTFTVGVLALSLHVGAYLAEVFRAGIQSIERGQIDSARSLGLSKAQTFRTITLPQAMINVVPPSLTYVLIMLKITALISIVGGRDFFYTINQVNQVAYRSIELYTFAALVYFAIAMPFVIAITRLETRFRARWGR